MADKDMCPSTTFDTATSWTGQKLFHCGTCGRTFKTDRRHPKSGPTTRSHDRTMGMVWAYAKNKSNTTEVTETFPAKHGIPLRLSFAASAIREHFEGDEEIEPLLDRMNDDEVNEAGEAALSDDRLYAVFHEILCDAVRDEAGIDLSA